LISAITNQGKVRFMINNGTRNAQMFIQFCRRPTKDAGKKVFLIFYNLRVHQSHVVKQSIEKHNEKIRPFFLPSYSPELNPDEYLNCDLKTGVYTGVSARSKD